VGGSKACRGGTQAGAGLEALSFVSGGLTLYGLLRASSQQWSTAEVSLLSAIRTDPGYSLAYVVLAGVYNGQLRFDDPQEAINQALSAGVDTWDVQYEIARSLIGKQEYDRVLSITETAQHRKHNPLLHLAKAHALLGLKRYRQSITELQTYLHHEPNDEGSRNARNLLALLQTIARE